MLKKQSKRTLRDPKITAWFSNNPHSAWIWLPIRIWLGYQWINASLHKITNPAWVQTGDALKGFWTAAVAIPESGRPVIAYDWYRSFIQTMLDAEAYTWFGKLIAYGEIAVGAALILGFFTGIAAFFGGFMNWNFLMAGSASTNPVLFVVSIALILAWKVAGFYGVDYFLLHSLGVPVSSEVENRGIPQQELGARHASP
ncbi:MAG: DoxX family membrane protein [Anaerolineales bacterium]|nr:DoxX family membrane protein [Anaerolineales bacterium]